MIVYLIDKKVYNSWFMLEFRNELGTVLEKYKSAKYSFFKWRFESTFTDRYVKSRSFIGSFSLMLLGIAIIYLFGVVQVSLVLGVNAQKAIALGALPFIGIDVYKALIASAIATAVTPGSAYGNEVDSR